ncbi:hypothetical protein [uncultured Chryseobacterium sp.]|uniref:hypothetical protein n=1 Tax=uncultured Chryseobacterium sp. TaxID=259322 RepID=UPI0025F1C556|nr:hypothetical protein [uncultured Chryseobacterium sp.]
MKANDIKNICPTFPHFGINYRDAKCINGYLWDIANGMLYAGSDAPCPFCNTEEYLEWLGDEYSEEEKKIHLDFLNKKHNS